MVQFALSQQSQSTLRELEHLHSQWKLILAPLGVLVHHSACFRQQFCHLEQVGDTEHTRASYVIAWVCCLEADLLPVGAYGFTGLLLGK